MEPTKTVQPGMYQFSPLGHRQVVADFSGGQITSKAGLLLIAQLDRHFRITKQFAGCQAQRL